MYINYIQNYVDIDFKIIDTTVDKYKVHEIFD